MRYASGGIGHYKVDLMEGSRASAPPPESEPVADSDSEDAIDRDSALNTLDIAGNQDASFPTVNDADNADASGCDLAEEDSGEDSESDHDDLKSEHEGSKNYDEGSVLEENFGAEDGEGMFGDAEEEEGYAPLCQ